MRRRLLGDRYRLGPVIGAGGTGTVHRARDERLGIDVAVKVLRTGAAAADCERLRREVEYLGAVQHPNLVAVLDAGADGTDQDGGGRHGTAWFAMELVEGPDLRTLLQEHGPLEGAAVRRLLTGVLGALGAMHEAGLVHRDVTPSNILLTAGPFARWEPKLTDLGIARRLLSVPLTDVGRVVGTAAYLSPEQVVGGEVGPASDVYALALVAFEALTGSTPFPGSAAESATSRLVRSPTLPDALAPAWRSLLAAAASVDPEDRPTVAAFRTAVLALPDDAGLRPVAATVVPQRAGRTAVVASTALLPAVATADLATTAPHRRRSRTGLVVGASAILLAGVATLGSVALIGSQALPVSSQAQDAAASPAPRPSSTATAAAQPSEAALAPLDAAAAGPGAIGPALGAVAAPGEPGGPGAGGAGPGGPGAGTGPAGPGRAGP